MTYHIGEPWQSELAEALKYRDRSTTSKQKSRANSLIRSIRLEAAMAKGTHTKDQWVAYMKAFGGRCVMCGDEFELHEIQKDHIIPIYQGGSDGIENLQPLCKSCNAAKGPDATDWAQYRRIKGF